MVNRETTVSFDVSFNITVPSFDDSNSNIRDVVLAHTGDPKEGDSIRFQYGGWRARASGSGSKWTITYTVTYFTTAIQEQEIDYAVDSVLRTLHLDEKAEYETICAIYDYITENIVYDYINLEDDSYLLKYTAYAALINKTAVCQGYAVLLYRLLLESGIDCRVITGGNHAWNIIRIGSLYYDADSTWDAVCNLYEYYLRCDANFEDHVRGEEYSSASFYEEYPMSDKDYDPTGFMPSGACGDNMTWTLDENGVLTISGTGDMWDYSSDNLTFEDRGWNDYCDYIRSVVIQTGVTSIGDAAFAYCESLTDVTIPDGVTNIGDDAFNCCSSLESILIPDSVTDVGEYVFFNCTSLSNVVLSNSLTSIGPDMFEYCGSLTNIKIPDSVTSIEEFAFNGCTTLEEITMGHSVEIIGYAAFCDCDNLEQVYYTCTDEEFQEQLETIGSTLPEGDGNLPFMVADYVHIHTPGEAVHENEVAATCTEEGSYDEVVYCKVCGEELSREPKTVPTLTYRLSETDLTLVAGKTGTLKVTDDKGKTVPAVWSTSNDEIADVSSKGVVTAKKAGKAVITAAADGFSADCEVLVQFTDVTDSTRSFYAPVYWALENGITTGTSKTTFSPDKSCTRAQIVTFLWRLKGCPEPSSLESPFKDVTNTGASYYKAVLGAVENGITTGTSKTTFSPNSTCTRGQIVTFLYRYNFL